MIVDDKPRDGICGDESPHHALVPDFGGPRPPVCHLRFGHDSSWHESDTGQRWKYAAEGRPREITFDVGASGMTPDPLVVQLRQARAAAGLSIRALADAIGCAPSQLSDWENGKWPTAANLRRWAASLGVQPAWVPLADPQTALDVAEATADKNRDAMGVTS